MSARRSGGRHVDTLRRPGPSRRHRVAVAALAGLTLLTALSSPASGFWSVSSTPGTGASSASTVGAGATPQVSLRDRRDVTVTWPASTLSGGASVTGYVVRRLDAATGQTQTVLRGCAEVVRATTCTETGVPDGVWTYAVTPRVGTGWTGAESEASASVRTDATPPRNDIDRTEVTGGFTRVGADTFYYRGLAAGSFRLVNRLTDTGSGPDSSNTGQLSGDTGGWTHTASSVSTPQGGPFVSNVFSWTAGTTAEPVVGVAGVDRYGNVAASTLTFRLDNTPPTGGAIDYPNGSLTATSITVTTAAVADSQSRVGYRVLERARATLGSDNACGPYDAWTAHLQNPAASASVPVEAGNCYRYRYVVRDNVGNELVTTAPKAVRVRSYAARVRATAGLSAYWRLGEASGTAVAADVGASGTWAGGPTFRAAGALSGDPDTAVRFDGVDDHGRVQRTIADDFSVELWFRSDRGGLGTGDRWYDGAGLVDGDVPGVADDFGVSLLADGRVAAGTGNPDTTVLSPAGFDDDAWHHVVLTRTRSTGRVELFVDAVSRGAVTGGTAALTASADLSLGRLQNGTNHLRGSLDEVALYTTALPAATITAHYRAGMP